MNASVLVIEDDRFLQENLLKLLRAEGYTAAGVASGEEALECLEQSAHDLLVLDLGLPGMDGLTTCRRIRAKWQMPVLMLTARTDAMDKVMGLETGADDYLTKPFDAMEFVARVRAQLRRALDYRPAKESPAAAQFVLGDLTVDFEKRQVWLGAMLLDLTSKEFEIIAYLAKNCDRAISRDQIFEQIWGYDMDFNTNSLDVYMYRIRRKLQGPSRSRQYLHTLRGYGYKLGLNP